MKLFSGSGRRVRAALLATVTAATVVFATPSPSMADGTYFNWCDDPGVSCQTGSGPFGERSADYCFGGGAYGTEVCLVYSGDIIWVKDGKADGNSAIAEIIVPSNGSRRYCRNPYGYGTWAGCDFDWPEQTGKRLYGGVRWNNSTITTNWMGSFAGG